MGEVFLLDVNILLAFSEKGHHHNALVEQFLERPSIAFAVCSFTEVGFVRLAMNPAVGARAWTAVEAVEFLDDVAEIPGYRFWPLENNARRSIGPFLPNMQGHNQVTDAHLLGLAVSRDGVLVTTDKKLRATAGSKYLRHLLVLE